jgi:CBS domain-containing protein
MDEDRLVGLVTFGDVRKVSKDAWDDTRVSDIMTPLSELITVGPSADSAEAWDKLLQRDVGQLPVVESGKLLGMLRRRDLLRWLQLHSEIAGR